MTTPTQQETQVTAAKLAALIVLLEAQSQTRRQLSTAAVRAAVTAFTAVTDWWNPAKTTKAVRDVLRIVQPYQRQAARMTDAYLARAVSVLSGRNVRPAGAVDVTKLRRAIPQEVAEALAHDRVQPAFLLLGEFDPDNRRVIPAKTIGDPAALAVPDPNETVAQRTARARAGQSAAEVTDPGDAYGRIADQYRFQVTTKDADPAKARKFVLARVSALAATDITLAVREQVRATLGELRDVSGYRRILRPELSESGPCGLCVVAADRVYSIRDLKPLHDRCVCEVLPIVGGQDPGLKLNYDDLNAIYEKAGGTGAKGLKRIRVALAEHGELGPVLIDADQHYRGPKQVAVTKTVDKKARLQAQLDGWEESFARLIRRREAGEDVERPLEWQANRIDELRRELASL